MNHAARVSPEPFGQDLIALFDTGQWTRLEAAASKAVRRRPTQLLGWRALGKALLQQGKWQKAAQVLSQLVRDAPNEADAHNDLGYARFAMGRHRDAEASYRRALLLNPALAEAHANLGLVLTALGRFEEAAASHRAALSLNPTSPIAHNNLATAQKDLGRLTEAEASLRQAIALAPGYAEAHANLGAVLAAAGAFAEAAACFRTALTLAPANGAVHNNLGTVLREAGDAAAAEASFRQALLCDPTMAEAHANLGTILAAQRRYQEAEACYRHALTLDPNAAATHDNLGSTLRALGRLTEAEACHRRALALAPGSAAAQVNLGAVLADLARWDEAIAVYRIAATAYPLSTPALAALGRLLSRFPGLEEEAASCLERAIVLDPANADAQADLGNILIRRGRTEEAIEVFGRSKAARPLMTWRANRAPAAFSVLFLDTPLAGSTPMHYLAGRADYDRHFYCVLPDGRDDLDLLRAHADVVFNMICNADDGAGILPIAHDLADRIGRPVINHPSKIVLTDRAQIAGRLAGIPGCAVPRTIRLSARALAEAAARQTLEDFQPPMLIRLAGTHGGDDFEKCETWSAAAAFAADRPDAECYLTEYHDYRSDDGLFRKYRLIFIDQEILPYHLAIHDDWKVHHFRTDMANRPELRREEERFLADMNQVFDAPARAALRAISAAAGLDYGGLDCGIDRQGRIVVFETNASMLVHDEPEGPFAYKNQYIARVKQAFDAMLARRCAGA